MRTREVVCTAVGADRAWFAARSATTEAGWAANEGGGIHIDTPESARIENCIIARNRALWGGGINEVAAATHYDQCTIVDNVATDEGGAIFNAYYFAPPRSLTNSIVRGNTPDQFDGFTDSLTVRYSNVQNGWPGEGNLDLDPRFRTLGPFEYLLGPASPSIDAGDPTVDDALSDWHPRWPAHLPNGTRSDMGAYGGPENRGWLGAPWVPVVAAEPPPVRLGGRSNEAGGSTTR